MVTLPVPQRLAFAQQSIRDYCAQTWTEKDLLVVADGGSVDIRQALLDHVAALGRRDIRVLASPHPGSQISYLRNFAVAEAAGALICQWDDDDRHHPQRLERQAALLTDSDADAVYLQDVMQYFPTQGAMFWTNWRATPATAHPGTLMARRSAMPSYPDHVRLGEDLVVARDFIERGRVAAVAGSAHLYVYVSHGANSWDDAHHTMLSKNLAISRALIRRRESEIRAGLLPFGLPAGVVLWGSNGEGFAL